MNENFQDTDLDERNTELGYMLKRLRQNIDIDRIIGLNVDPLRKSSIGDPFIGYLKEQAICFIALDISKIYEKKKKIKKKTYNLNSIEGVISAIPDHVKTDDKDKIQHINKIFKDHDIQTCKSDNLKTILLCALEQIEDRYKNELENLKNLRDKYIAHSDSDFSSATLASHNDYEALLKFGYKIYDLISGNYVGTKAAFLGAKVGTDFKKMIKKHGISNPIITYEQRDRLKYSTS